MTDRELPALCLAHKQLFIFDMDGTIYLGRRVFDFAIRFIRHLRENGYRVLFFTNNASHSTAFYVEKLARLGFCPAGDEVLTSADITLAYLRAYAPDQRVYLVGTQELADQFAAEGIPLLTGEETSADIVVTSFDTELTYEKLCHATHFIRGGATYLSTHPDFNCPTDTGFIPDSGAIAALVTASTGISPRYFGKPYAEVVDMIEKVTGVARENMCIFGDRLYTDIALGAHHGVTSALVLTGEATREEAEALPAADRPTFIFSSLAEVDEIMFPPSESSSVLHRKEHDHGI